MNKDECCPKFNPKKWDEKTFVWKNKLFIKESIPTLFHMPFPPMIGKKITKMMNLASNPNRIDSKKNDVLVLFRDPSAFRSEIYISVTGEVAKANNIKISGTFKSKVFEGPYNAIPSFIKQMNQYLGKEVASEDYYVHYAYCPKCEKKFGHNYMILFAKF